MRILPAFAAALLTAPLVAGSAAAQTAAPPVSPEVRETAGCAAVFMAMGQLATSQEVVGSDPLAGMLGGMFGRSFTQKGRALHARATAQARRDRLPPEAVFESGVTYLIETYAAARAGGAVDPTTEAARLVERCVAAFPDGPADF